MKSLADTSCATDSEAHDLSASIRILMAEALKLQKVIHLLDFTVVFIGVACLICHMVSLIISGQSTTVRKRPKNYDLQLSWTFLQVLHGSFFFISLTHVFIGPEFVNLILMVLFIICYLLARDNKWKSYKKLMLPYSLRWHLALTLTYMGFCTFQVLFGCSAFIPGMLPTSLFS